MPMSATGPGEGQSDFEARIHARILHPFGAQGDKNGSIAVFISV